MKKYLIFLSLVLTTPTLMLGSCYDIWIMCYNAGEAQYVSDVYYCATRGLDTKTLACFRHAEYDFNQTVETCGEAFYWCVEE